MSINYLTLDGSSETTNKVYETFFILFVRFARKILIPALQNFWYDTWMLPNSLNCELSESIWFRWSTGWCWKFNWSTNNYVKRKFPNKLNFITILVCHFPQSPGSKTMKATVNYDIPCPSLFVYIPSFNFISQLLWLFLTIGLKDSLIIFNWKLFVNLLQPFWNHESFHWKP